MDEDCMNCVHYRGGYQRIVVDGRTADAWEEWGCEKERELTDDDWACIDQGVCRFYQKMELEPEIINCPSCGGMADFVHEKGHTFGYYYCPICEGRDDE